MAKTVSLKNISHAFLEKPILTGVSFKFTDNERICIVGDNGTGKSTLLKIITGALEPDAGKVETTGHVRFYYVPQEFPHDHLAQSVQHFMDTFAGPTLFKKIFATGKQLGFNLEKNLEKECRLLSGGQQKILALSVGLATAPDFLMLDEPENHLDIVSRLELIKVLQAYRGGILFVSHDRLMVDSVATKVAEVVGGKAYISEGGYQDYIDQRLSRIAGLQRAFDGDTKRIKQLQAMLPILEQKAFRGKDVPTFLKRKAELAELKEKQADSPRAKDARTKIRLQESTSALHNGKLLCRMENASFRYPERTGEIFHGASFDIRTGSHLVLLGRNGTGKSTFLKCLTGNLPLTTGTVRWMEGVQSAYFDQHAAFDPQMTALEVIIDQLDLTDTKARAALGAMKFSTDKMETRTEALSGGERMRLRFALVFGVNPDFIILDEPTNNLDEVTWQILLDACNATKSTILLVTHDYEFIQELEQKHFLLIKNQTIQERYKDLEEIIEELR